MEYNRKKKTFILATINQKQSFSDLVQEVKTPIHSPVLLTNERCPIADTLNHRFISSEFYGYFLTGIMVKVTLLSQGRRIKKKRTENAKLSTCPSWNEPLVLPFPANALEELTIHLDVCKDRLSGSEVKVIDMLKYSRILDP